MIYDIVLFTDMDTRFWHVKPVGAYQLATELRKNGYSVKVVDFLARWLAEPKEFHKLITKIVSDQTLFVGFSGAFFIDNNTRHNTVTNWQEYYNYGKKIQVWPTSSDQMTVHFKWIKKLFPQIKLVYGGVFSNIVYGGTLSNLLLSALYNDMDYIIKGAADNTIVELAHHLSKGTALKYMPTAGHAKIIDHDSNAVSFNFSDSLVSYLPEDNVIPGEVLFIETARGCMFKCSFCSYPLLGRKKSDPVYHKKVESLAQEFKSNFENHQVNTYMFVDETFNETTDKIHDVIKARDLSGVDISFSCYLRTDLIAKFPEQIPLLKNLGIKTAFLGIESLYEPSARAIGKGCDPETIKDTIQKMKDTWGPEVKILGSFIVGLPEDNPKTLATWVDWVADKNCPIDYPFFGVLSMEKGGMSEISLNPGRFGYSIDDTHRWSNQHWNQTQATEYAFDIMQQFWQSGRLGIAAWDFMGYQNLGYTAKDLCKLTIDSLDFENLKEKKYQQWQCYKTAVFSYENIIS
jgi:hypothetical protein